jgi:hypothetical protein
VFPQLKQRGGAETQVVKSTDSAVLRGNRRLDLSSVSGHASFVAVRRIPKSALFFYG